MKNKIKDKIEADGFSNPPLGSLNFGKLFCEINRCCQLSEQHTGTKIDQLFVC